MYMYNGMICYNIIMVLYVCMSVCMCMCVYVCVYMCIYIYIYIYNTSCMYARKQASRGRAQTSACSHPCPSEYSCIVGSQQVRAYDDRA